MGLFGCYHTGRQLGLCQFRFGNCRWLLDLRDRRLSSWFSVLHLGLLRRHLLPATLQHYRRDHNQNLLHA